MVPDVSDEIMAATYRALCEHGFAEVTMQDIADETDKSKAALHYHYESKRDLLLAFLDFLYEEFTDRVSDPPGETPAERLTALVERVLTPPEPEGHTHREFGTAMLELKAQAPYDEAVRERMEAFDEFLFEHIRESVVAGIETGQFRDVDPDATARFIVTAIDGARTKEVAIGQDLASTRKMLRTYIETYLATASDDAPPVQPNGGVR